MFGLMRPPSDRRQARKLQMASRGHRQSVRVSLPNQDACRRRRLRRRLDPRMLQVARRLPSHGTVKIVARAKRYGSPGYVVGIGVGLCPVVS